MPGKENKETILISILNYRNYGDTIACLQQLYALKDTGVKLLVVDNHSQNGSVEKIKDAFPDVGIIESPMNKGFAAGHKIAADFAIEYNFELLWILNPDVIINKNTLSELVEAYRHNGQAIYGSVSVDETEQDKIVFGGAYEIKNGNPEEVYDFLKIESLSEQQKISKENIVGSVEGFSMLVPVDVIRKHGFMDTGYFMYGEETDYCLMLQAKRIPSYIVTGSVIVHKSEGSFQKSEGAAKVIAYYRSRNHRLIHKKYFGLKNNIIFKSAGGFVPLIWFIFVRFFALKSKTKDYYHYLGMLHAAWNIRGKRIKPEKFL